MNPLRLVIVLLAIVSITFPLFAANRSGTQVLIDFDIKEKVFSFVNGLVTEKESWDLMFDLPQGLASNNKMLVKRFKNGGIIDMGKVPLSTIKQAPKTGYIPALKSDQILVGHSYCVKLSSGLEFGKIHIINFDKNTQSIKFSWELANGKSRNFN